MTGTEANVFPGVPVEWQFTPYSVPPLLAAAVAIPVAVAAWRNREETAAETFLAVVIGLFSWSLIYGLQIGFQSVRIQAFWNSLTLIIGSTLPPLWLLFTFRYAGLEAHLGRRLYALLSAEPVLIALLVSTNGSHRLIWTSVHSGDAAGVTFAYTPLYFAHLFYLYGLVVASIGALAWVAADATTVYRKQSLVLLVATLLPFGANVFTRFGLSPVSGVDLTTFGFGVSVSVIALAMFRFDLLDVSAVARHHLMDHLGDGVVVVNQENTVVEANRTARVALDPRPIVGEPVEPSLPGETPEAADGRLVECTHGGERAFYEIRYTPLTDHRGAVAGALVGLREVTDRIQYERRLNVANRVLRHNFRNAMNVVQGHAQLLSGDLSGRQARHAAAIERRASEVIDLNEGIQQIVATIDRQGSAVTVELSEPVKSAVGSARRDYPDVVFAVDAERMHASVVDKELLRMALEQLLENAAAYNDADEPTVRLGIEAGDERVRIRVADNGPGIPEEERSVVTGQEETPLSHSSGLGLWLVSWVAEASGGELRFEENEPRGSIVAFDLPLPGSQDETTAADAPQPQVD